MMRSLSFRIFLFAIVIVCHPVLAGNEPGSALDLPTLYVVGDSTASNGADLGWGSHLAKYFDASKINVVNRARGGRSSRTFQTEGLWDRVLEEMKPGDFVLIQFGHNDGGAINDERRARGSLRGLGEETEEIDNLVTHKHEVVHTYGWYMRKYIADVKARGATPIVLSLTVRNIWRDGKVERGSGRYSQWAAEVATSQDTALVDVTTIIADEYERLGQERVAEFFPQDHTHTSTEGADLNAALIVSGLKSLPGDPFRNVLSRDGHGVKSYNDVVMTRTWMPDVQPVSDPNLPTLFLIGDSTVRTGSKGDGANGQWGWGAPIAEFFDRTRINVENRAMGGTSSRTFRTLGLWDEVLADIEPGDFVMMQFGHNDSSPVNDTRRARGTIKGAGPETEEVDNLLTGKHEVVHTYGWYIRQFIADARAKGATSIVCSPIPRDNWQDGKVARASHDYGQWASQAAKAEGAAFIDLNEIIAGRYEGLDQETVSIQFFTTWDHTHTSAAGAKFNAQCVIEGLESLDNHPLTNYLLNKVR